MIERKATDLKKMWNSKLVEPRIGLGPSVHRFLQLWIQRLLLRIPVLRINKRRLQCSRSQFFPGEVVEKRMPLCSGCRGRPSCIRVFVEPPHDEICCVIVNVGWQLRCEEWQEHLTLPGGTELAERWLAEGSPYRQAMGSIGPQVLTELRRCLNSLGDSGLRLPMRHQVIQGERSTP